MVETKPEIKDNLGYCNKHNLLYGCKWRGCPKCR